jgi:hypothetical protein
MMERLHAAKIIKYNDNDPRYGFTIKDSDEFNTEIRPFQIKKICTDPCNGAWQRESLPLATGTLVRVPLCWEQRYENCIDPGPQTELELLPDMITGWDSGPDQLMNRSTRTKYYKKDQNNCSGCKIQLYGSAQATLDWQSLKDFNPKQLKPNSFYDQTRISTIMHPDIVVDTSPDTSRSPNLNPMNNKKEPSIEWFAEESTDHLLLVLLCVSLFIVMVSGP